MDDMLTYVENPKNWQKKKKIKKKLKKSETKNYSKLVGYKVNTQNSTGFLYTSNK